MGRVARDYRCLARERRRDRLRDDGICRRCRPRGGPWIDVFEHHFRLSERREIVLRLPDLSRGGQDVPLQLGDALGEPCILAFRQGRSLQRHLKLISFRFELRHPLRRDLDRLLIRTPDEQERQRDAHEQGRQ
jgi:hypothetical protein